MARADILRPAGPVTTFVRPIPLLLLILLSAGPARSAADPAGAVRAREQAAALYAQALHWLSDGTVERRRQALRVLEQATLLEPGNATYEVALARTCYACGFLRDARRHFERAAAAQPADADGHLGLGPKKAVLYSPAEG